MRSAARSSSGSAECSPITNSLYLYLASDLRSAGLLGLDALARTTERHHVEIVPPPLETIADPAVEIARAGSAGIVFELATGLPTARHLDLIDGALRQERRAWLYWPREQAVECVDRERLESLRRHLNAVRWLRRTAAPLDRGIARFRRTGAGLRWIYRGEFPVRRSDVAAALDRLIVRAQPVPFESDDPGLGGPRLPDVGVYLRTDFWNAAADDPSTDLVTRELEAIAGRIVCLTPHRDPRLDDRRARQVTMDPPRAIEGQDAMVLAPAHYLPIVKIACQAVAPAFLYERLAAGQSAGAEASQLLRIPYIVEFPGSDALLRDALGGAPPLYPELYARAEELALRQASAVIVPSDAVRASVVARGIAAERLVVAVQPADLARGLRLLLAGRPDRQPAMAIATGDAYKDQVQSQWNENPVGSHHARESQPHTLDWFREVERHRYGVYAPWMPEMMEFAGHRGEDVLEIGGGMGTDLAQFASNGARVTDVDLAAGHLRLAEENFRLRGLTGRFVHHDAESLPFDDASFDVVYSNGVLHHTPDTAAVVREIHRVLRPGGRAIVMLYAEDSLHYWRQLVWQEGVRGGLLESLSMGEIMSRSVERSANDARPLVKVYTRRRAEALFTAFDRVHVEQRQLLAQELPSTLKWTARSAERAFGWNLIVKATRRPADVRH